MLDAADLPDDIAALKAMLIAAQARKDRKDERIERLEKLVAALKQVPSGFKGATPDQRISTGRPRSWAAKVSISTDPRLQIGSAGQRSSCAQSSTL